MFESRKPKNLSTIPEPSINERRTIIIASSEEKPISLKALVITRYAI
jgi:hypothetical protein